MAVYVDDYRVPYRDRRICHMIADTEAELHAMAGRLGVTRRWFHRGDHYDVTEEQRAAAIALGAVPISARDCATMAVHRRRTGGGRLPAPEEVPAIQEERARVIQARLARREAAG
jgi:hypothetical protein